MANSDRRVTSRHADQLVPRSNPATPPHCRLGKVSRLSKRCQNALSYRGRHAQAVQSFRIQPAPPFVRNWAENCSLKRTHAALVESQILSTLDNPVRFYVETSEFWRYLASGGDILCLALMCLGGIAAWRRCVGSIKSQTKNWSRAGWRAMSSEPVHNRDFRAAPWMPPQG